VFEGVQHLLPALRLRPAGHLRQRERLPLLRQHDHQGRQAQVPLIHRVIIDRQLAVVADSPGTVAMRHALHDTSSY
jgi:hypothetical protein